MSITCRRVVRLFTVVAVVGLTGCSLLPWQSSRYGGKTSEVFFLNVGSSKNREISYTIRLGQDIADVYFAFVNYGNTATTVPAVVSSTVPAGSVVNGQAGRKASGRSASLVSGRHHIHPRTIVDFNRNPPPFVEGPAGTSVVSRGVGPGAPGESVGETESLYQYSGDFDNPVQTPATLRAVVTDGNGIQLNIWVEDALYLDADPGSTGLITPAKVDALADEFLVAGGNNDIYDWVSSMLGVPWGPHNYINLIDPEAANTVNIFLVDILRDGATDSGVVGYFWGKDNYYRTASGQDSDESNERLMFYLDARMYGQLEDGWSPANSWPQLVFSTLAHEFQHMIHFYQKNVLRGVTDSERWLNEMLSLVTEDLVAYEMGVPGPRGVSSVSEPSGGPGPGGNRNGWLGLFNEHNDLSLYAWDFADPTPNYAIAYGYGSFLVRNHGGAELVRAMVQNEFGGSEAIEYALDELGRRVTLRESLSEWAAAVLTSDEIIDPTAWGALDSVYNTGTWFESSLDGQIYLLGSIDLYRHESNGTIGPKIHSGAVGDESSRPPASVVYYRAGSGLSGTHAWTLNLGPNTDVVVVAKKAD